MSRPKVVVEQSIPYLKGLVEQYAEVTYLGSADFVPSMLRGAEALIVRSITPCRADTLPSEGLSLISTATAGYDHIDTDYCQRQGIAWANAAGCNSRSVAQYVFSALSSLALRDGLALSELTLGIVGVGYAGRAVASLARALGMRTLLYDPPRAEREGDEGFASLQDIVECSDVITLHVPLTKVGRHATYQMVDRAFLSRCRRRPILINACRGAVCASEALVWAKGEGLLSSLVIDCWEGEPRIDARLLESADIASPHIAGFSADGKQRASLLALEAVCSHFALPCEDLWQRATQLDPPSAPHIALDDVPEVEQVPRAMLHTLDLKRITEELKAQPEIFESLRRGYAYPREMQAYWVSGASEHSAQVLSAMGFELDADASSVNTAKG